MYIIVLQGVLLISHDMGLQIFISWHNVLEIRFVDFRRLVEITRSHIFINVTIEIIIVFPPDMICIFILFIAFITDLSPQTVDF